MREDLRQRLRELNGGALSEEPAVLPSDPVEEKRIPLHKRKDRAAKNVEWREWGQSDPAPIRNEPPPPDLSAILPGEERHHQTRGAHYLIRTLPHQAPEMSWGDLGVRFRSTWSGIPGEKTLKRFSAQNPEGFLFFDIETTGLSGSPVFLIGLMRLQGPYFVVDQLLARRFSEEAAIVAETLEAMSRAEALVSFNGKSFDLPFILNRAAHHRLPLQEGPEHIDLLHHARRRWRRMVPNCRLQTLEQYLCGRERIDDVPSHMIPYVYRRFVADSDPRPLQPVLSHNLLDLVTMAELLMRLWE